MGGQPLPERIAELLGALDALPYAIEVYVEVEPVFSPYDRGLDILTKL